MSSSFFSLSPVGSSQIQRHQPLTAVGSPEPILKAGPPARRPASLRDRFMRDGLSPP